jgi:hypothetical protein
MHSTCKIPIPDIREMITVDTREKYADSIQKSTDSKAGTLYCPDCGCLLTFIKLVLPCQAGFWDSG